MDTDNKNKTSLQLVDINRPTELEWELFVTNENISNESNRNFTPDSLESKFLAETNTDETKDVDSMFSCCSYIEQNSIWKIAASKFQIKWGFLGKITR